MVGSGTAAGEYPIFTVVGMADALGVLGETGMGVVAAVRGDADACFLTPAVGVRFPSLLVRELSARGVTLILRVVEDPPPPPPP